MYQELAKGRVVWANDKYTPNARDFTFQDCGSRDNYVIDPLPRRWDSTTVWMKKITVDDKEGAYYPIKFPDFKFPPDIRHHAWQEIPFHGTSAVSVILQ